MFNSDVSGGFSSFAGSTWPLEDDADFLTLLSDPKAAQTLSLGTVQPSDLNSRQLNISPPSSEADSPPSQSAGPQLATQTSTTITPFSSTGLNDMNANSRATRSANRDSQTGEPAPKRRLLDDVDEESDDDSLQRSKKTSTKRKSIGGPDESRLMKRKEQNRAAQRAFRERKERHVKDLEDKVSILEAKTDTQAAENENLRELLTRLQQENLQLKQTQFNFTFQQPIASTSANANSSAQPYPTRQASTSSDTNMAGPTASGPSPSSQSPMDASSLTRPTNGTVHASSSTPQLTNSSASPNDLNLLESLGLSTSTPDLSFPGISPAGQGSNSNQGSFTMMDTSFFNNTPSANGASTDFNSFDLGGFTPMPFQTIAASPWSSYRDPSANPNAWASFGPNSSQSLALNTYDELFGGAGSLSGLPSAGPDSSMAGSAIDDLMPFSFMPDLSSGNGGSQFGGLSPISHLPTPPSATAAPATNSSTSGKQVTTPISKDHDMSNSESPHDASAHTGEDTGDCPRSKEEFAEHIQKMGSGTFGPPIDGSIGIIAIPSALASGSTGPSPSGSSGNAESGDASCTKKMPMADSTKLNLDLGTAWRAVRQHPQFEECDIDELCAELAQKATCDGNTKVIEAQKIMDLVHSIPERAKQRKLSMAARMSA